jgi:hypothetical protein
MANILYPPSRPQSVGEILDSTFRIFGATLVKCLPFAIAGVILGQLANLYNVAKNGKPGLDPAAQLALFGDRIFWLCYVVGFLLAVLFANAVMLRQYALLSGGQLAGGGVLQRATARMPGVVLIMIVMLLAMLTTMIPVIFVVAVPFGVAGAFRGVGGPQTAIWGALVFFLVAVVAVSWIVIRWICSTIVYLLTDRGPLESMSYSWRLTSGSFWRLFVIYSVAVVILIVFYFIFTLLGTAVAGVLAHGDVVVMTGVMSMVVVVLGAIFAPFYSALMLAVYGDLMVRKEGADLASRLAVTE